MLVILWLASIPVHCKTGEFYSVLFLCLWSALFSLGSRLNLLNTSARIISNNGGTAPLTYKKFLAIVRSLGPPEHPYPTLDVQLLAGCYTPVSEDHEEKFGVPSLKELGLDVSQLSTEVWHGGETEALVRLDRHLERKVRFY